MPGNWFNEEFLILEEKRKRITGTEDTWQPESN